MRTTIVRIALITGLLVAVSTLPAAATGEEDSVTKAKPGKVSFGIPLWTTKSGDHRTTVRVRYPSDQPPAWWDGQPVEIQVRHRGGEWETAGTADQQPVPGRAASRTRMTYTLPIHGKVQIRAKAYSTQSSIASKARKLTVAPTTPAYDPTALPNTDEYCWDPVIARNPSRLAYGCAAPMNEYGWNTWLYDHDTGKRTRLDTYSDYPDLASDANVLVAHKLVYGGELLETYRARRYNPKTGRSRWIAYKRNGKRAYEAVDASISANGKRIAYSSNTPGISPKAPKKGTHVYSVRTGNKRSRYLGDGSDTQIAAFGRYVVWRNPYGKIRRYDLRKGKATSITKRKGDHRGSPDVSAGGRYVTYSEVRKGDRVVRIADAKTGKKQTIAKGESPVLSDNGRYVAYLGENERELYLWDRNTGKSALLTVGPSGEGSGAKVGVPDISPNGRWIVAATESEKVAPDNGRIEAKDRIVLFDRKAG